MPAIKKVKKIDIKKEFPPEGDGLLKVYTDQSVRVRAFYKNKKFTTLMSKRDITVLVTHWDK